MSSLQQARFLYCWRIICIGNDRRSNHQGKRKRTRETIDERKEILIYAQFAVVSLCSFFKEMVPHVQLVYRRVSHPSNSSPFLVGMDGEKSLGNVDQPRGFDRLNICHNFLLQAIRE
jgi:hypothetical protein